LLTARRNRRNNGNNSHAIGATTRRIVVKRTQVALVTARVKPQEREHAARMVGCRSSRRSRSGASFGDIVGSVLKARETK